MSKIVLIIVAAAVIIAVVWGVYFVVSLNKSSSAPKSGSAPANNQGQNQGANSSVFEIQGMKVEILKEGGGEGAKDGNTVTVHYTGTFTSGQKFDSSFDRNAPFPFKLGAGRVIKGWDLGVVGMKVGEKRKLTIPPQLAYGSSGFLDRIPPNSTLIFEIEMLKIGN